MIRINEPAISFTLVLALFFFKGTTITHAGSILTNVSQPKIIASVEVPHSNGQIMFLDETPDAKIPSISLIIVEDSRYDTLADSAKSQSVTPLEIFQAYAPKVVKLNDRLQLDHKLRRTASPKNPIEDWPLVAVPRGTTGEDNTAPIDEWANGCTNSNQWRSGFDNYAGFHFGSVTTHTSLTWDAPDPRYLTLPAANRTWVGMCMRSGLMLHVLMHYQNSEGDWLDVPGPGGNSIFVFPGHRYLYQQTSSNSLLTLRLALGPFVDDDGEISVFLSGKTLKGAVYEGL